MPIQLGCIADDVTGATDLANELRLQGLRTWLFLGTTFPDAAPDDSDAVVVALKTRTAPVLEAVRESLRALTWLQSLHVPTIYFKYCSTFDSCATGNIGPITDALLDAMGESFTIACPAFPRTGRTVYQGCLFVNGTLLAESPMRHHPLTPMTDSHLVRLLDGQTQGKVALLPFETIAQGSQAIQAALQEARKNHRYAIVDAITDDHLIQIGHAALHQVKLITGASGLAYGVARALVQSGIIPPRTHNDNLPDVANRAAVIAGSCSKATLAQIDYMKQTCPAYAIDIADIVDGSPVVATVAAWAQKHVDQSPVLIYSSTPPEKLHSIQQQYGADHAGHWIEQTNAKIAKALFDLGVRRFIIAGGETAGAVVRELGISALQIGPEIDPGVPWTVPLLDTPMVLALKSGNFGSKEFFIKALGMLSSPKQFCN
jgi:3-dehydrotetronate 4-kinase